VKTPTDSKNAIFLSIEDEDTEWSLVSFKQSSEHLFQLHPDFIHFSATIPFNSVTNIEHIPDMLERIDQLWRQELYDAVTSQLDFEHATFLERETGYTITVVPASKGQQIIIRGAKNLVMWNWSYKPPPPEEKYPTTAKEIAEIIVEEE